MSCVVVVAESDDLLTALVKTSLEARGDQVMAVSPGALGGLAVRLEGDAFRVEDERIGGILFRATPDTTFSDGFEAADRSFCDAEVRALWLAAMSLDSVCALNRYDAAAWFEGPYWPVWRRRLIASGIPVSPFAFGGNGSAGWWYPYRSYRPQTLPGPAARRVLGSATSAAVPAQRTLAVDREVLAGDGCTSALAALRLLSEAGIRLAEVFTDRDGRLLAVDTLPLIADPSLAVEVSDRVVGIYHDHLHRR
jgi:hypothetical protein